MSTITLYSLSDYNNGILEPKIFNLDNYFDISEYYSDVSGWLSELDSMDKTRAYSPREEWIVCDYEGIPKEYVGEYDLDEGYFEYRDAVENSYLDEEVFEAASDLDIPFCEVEDRYYGEFNSDSDFAYELLESTGELGDIPETLRYYFDYESYGRDLLIDDFVEHNGHYFSRC